MFKINIYHIITYLNTAKKNSYFYCDIKSLKGLAIKDVISYSVQLKLSIK